jgi:O-antigen/teichoic acid export membrane protein
VLVNIAPGNGLFASWTIPVLCSLVPINLLLFNRLLPAQGDRATRPSMRPLVRRMAALSAGDYPGSLAYLASITAMPILVARMVGLEQAAYFYTAWMLATSADLVLSAIAISATVEGAHDLRSFSTTVGKAVRLYAMVLVPLVAALVFGARLVLGIFGHGYQASATGLLQLVALSLPARAVVHLALASCRIDGRPRAIFLIHLASGVGVLGGAFVLLSPMGIVGVGVAYLVSQSALAVVLVPSLRRRSKQDARTVEAAVDLALIPVLP